MEAQLTRGPLQRRGRAVVDDGVVRVHYPKWPEPWTFNAVDVTLAGLPEGSPSPAQLSIPVDEPAVFPRLEVVRIRAERAPNLYLVLRTPARVPRTRRERWCDVVALTVREEAFGEVAAAGLSRAPTVDDALERLYGTTRSPRIPSGGFQTGWYVEGVALVGGGPWSSDPRPVARSTGPAPEGVQRAEQRGRRRSVVLAIAASLVGTAAWALAAHVDADHAGAWALGLGFLVGFATRWPRRHQARTEKGLGLLAGALTLAAVVLGLAAANIVEAAQYQGSDVAHTARSFVENGDWADLGGGWFDNVGGYLATAVACWVAYLAGLGGSTGSATKAS